METLTPQVTTNLVIPEQRMNEQPRRVESLTLAALPSAANSARSFVTSVLEKWGAPLVISDAVELAEAMVASAVRTTGVSDPAVSWHKLPNLELIGVNLVGLRRSIGLEVWDSDPSEPVDFQADNPAGNPLVDMLKAVALNWGFIPSGRGKVVWAELAVYRQAENGLPIRPKVPSPYPREVRPALKRPNLEIMQRVRDGLRRLT